MGREEQTARRLLVMARVFTKTAIFFAVVLSSSTVSAGIYTDDLSKCLVKSSSPEDQTMFMQWIFALLSLNPAVEPLSSITSTQRDALNQRVARLYERLLLDDCRNETVDALKYEGPGAIEASFGVLGQVASRGLMTDPSVASARWSTEYFDKGKWVELLKEAGFAQ
jgi:hypothetical protein